VHEGSSGADFHAAITEGATGKEKAQRNGAKMMRHYQQSVD